MRQATRAQWIKCTIAILLYLAFLIWVRRLVGVDCRSFHFRYLYHQENTLVILEEVENPTVRSS